MVPGKSSGQCQNCMITNKVEGLKDLFRMIKVESEDYVCEKGHLLCNFCSYLANNRPSYYRDHNGNYLYNLLTFDIPLCSKGHQMKIVPLTSK